MNAYYKLLGLSAPCTIEDVRKAYRLLAKKYHPDVNPSEDATIRFREIDEAAQRIILALDPNYRGTTSVPDYFDYLEKILSQENNLTQYLKRTNCSAIGCVRDCFQCDDYDGDDIEMESIDSESDTAMLSELTNYNRTEFKHVGSKMPYPLNFADKWGYGNSDYQLIIPFEYDFADEFVVLNGDVIGAVVYKNGFWGIIGPNNEQLLPLIFKGIDQEVHLLAEDKPSYPVSIISESDVSGDVLININRDIRFANHTPDEFFAIYPESKAWFRKNTDKLSGRVWINENEYNSLNLCLEIQNGTL